MGFEVGAEDVTNVGHHQALLEAQLQLAEQPLAAVSDGQDVAVGDEPF